MADSEQGVDLLPFVWTRVIASRSSLSLPRPGAASIWRMTPAIDSSSPAFSRRAIVLRRVDAEVAEERHLAGRLGKGAVDDDVGDTDFSLGRPFRLRLSCWRLLCLSSASFFGLRFLAGGLAGVSAFLAFLADSVLASSFGLPPWPRPRRLWQLLRRRPSSSASLVGLLGHLLTFWRSPFPLCRRAVARVSSAGEAATVKRRSGHESREGHNGHISRARIHAS